MATGSLKYLWSRQVFTEGLAHLSTDAILPAFTFTIVVLLDVAGATQQSRASLILLFTGVTYGITRMAGLDEKPNWAFGGSASPNLLDLLVSQFGCLVLGFLYSLLCMWMLG